MHKQTAATLAIEQEGYAQTSAASVLYETQ